VHALGLFLDARLAGKVSQPEALVVMHLATHRGATINALHRTFGHRRSTLTSVLDRHEAKGYVRRRPGESDRRSVEVTLTPSGLRIAAEIARAFEALRAKLPPGSVEKIDLAALQRVADAASEAAPAS